MDFGKRPLNTGLTVKTEKFVLMSLILYDPDKGQSTVFKYVVSCTQDLCYKLWTIIYYCLLSLGRDR